MSVSREGEKVIVVLDATPFHPQGGGQPCDTGEIRSEAGWFVVESVRAADGIVRHIGRFEGPPFTSGARVRCAVDAGRRSLHSRIHSAGHVLDIAIRELGLAWTPAKGYHFPEGPYVEYAGTLEGRDRDALRGQIEARANAVVAGARPRGILFLSREEARARPEGAIDAPGDGAIRMVSFGDPGSPCSGTHVPDTSRIGTIAVRKVKAEKDRVRVAYAVV